MYEIVGVGVGVRVKVTDTHELRWIYKHNMSLQEQPLVAEYNLLHEVMINQSTFLIHFIGTTSEAVIYGLIYEALMITYRTIALR